MINNNHLSKYTTVFETGCKILYGPHAAAGYLLSITAEIAVRQPMHLLDFGNRCDMYYIARQLRYLTRDPAAALQNIRLQRAFTCYQALALLRQISGMEAGLPVVILDLLSPFLDENIKTAEIFRIYAEVTELLRDAMQVRPVLVGVKPVPQKLAPDRVCLVSSLARSFGLIPVGNTENEARYQLAEDKAFSGYLLRPAVQAFGERNMSEQTQGKPELMSGQPTLF